MGPTRGEPDGTELTPMGVELNGSCTITPGSLLVEAQGSAPGSLLAEVCTDNAVSCTLYLP